MPETFSRDDLLFIVSAANIIGHMEAQGIITVEDDEELTDFAIRAYKEFCGEPWENENWFDWIFWRARETYKNQEED